VVGAKKVTRGIFGGGSIPWTCHYVLYEHSREFDRAGA
jgi:hypothetical protein